MKNVKFIALSLEVFTYLTLPDLLQLFKDIYHSPYGPSASQTSGFQG